MRLIRVVIAGLLPDCMQFFREGRAIRGISAVDPAKAGWAPPALDELSAYVQSQKTGLPDHPDRKVIYSTTGRCPRSCRVCSSFTHGTDTHSRAQEDVASAQKSFDIRILASVAIDQGTFAGYLRPVSAYIGARMVQSRARTGDS